MYLKCTAVRFQLHVPCGDRHANCLAYWRPVIADFLTECPPFATAHLAVPLSLAYSIASTPQ
jgi:hypothetical protein